MAFALPLPGEAQREIAKLAQSQHWKASVGLWVSHELLLCFIEILILPSDTTLPGLLPHTNLGIDWK